MNARNYGKPVVFVSLCLLLGFSAPAGGAVRLEEAMGNNR